MEPEEHLEALRHSAGAFVTAVAGNLDRPVPSCPEWDVTDLAKHVGLVWRWAAAIVETGERAEWGEAPEGSGEDVVRWVGEQAARVLDALGAADPDSGCWTFGLPRTRRFWFRRQALETVLHLWDAQRAGGQPEAMDPEVAANGVDEFLTVMVPRGLRRTAGDWAGESVHLHRTDGTDGTDGSEGSGGEWTVHLGPDGAVSVTVGHAKADVALRGPAEALWLWCTNRAPLHALPIETFGDSQLAARWTAEISF